MFVQLKKKYSLAKTAIEAIIGDLSFLLPIFGAWIRKNVF